MIELYIFSDFVGSVPWQAQLPLILGVLSSRHSSRVSDRSKHYSCNETSLHN